MRAVFKALVVLLAAVALLPAAARAQAPELPTPTGFVNDYAGVIDGPSAQRMETMARNFRDKTGVDVAVVTVSSLEGRPIEDVALRLARGWGIGGGQEKEGVLVLLAIDDRRSRVEVSRHVEDEIPDITAFEILRASRDQFAAGQYGAGLSKALETILATVASARGVSIEGIDASRAYRQPAEAPRRQPGGFSCSPVMIIFILFILFVLFRGGGGGGGRRYRRRGGFIPFPVIIPWGGGGGSWGGGGGGGWSGGGGGGDSWGGFGGGGDFGGGGASDSW